MDNSKTSILSSVQLYIKKTGQAQRAHTRGKAAAQLSRQIQLLISPQGRDAEVNNPELYSNC